MSLPAIEIDPGQFDGRGLSAQKRLRNLNFIISPLAPRIGTLSGLDQITPTERTPFCIKHPGWQVTIRTRHTLSMIGARKSLVSHFELEPLKPKKVNMQEDFAPLLSSMQMN